jgi:NTE family protein
MRNNRTLSGRALRIAVALVTLTAALPVRAQNDPGPNVVLPYGVSRDRFAADAIWNNVRRLPVGDRPRIVLVLGGGGARGLAHIGVLRVFEEEGIPIDEIVGVSVGALIGALYSSGLSVDEIQQMAGDIGWQSLTDYSKTAMVRLILNDELLSSNGMETYLSNRIGNKHFSDLNIPFSCVATDIRTGERVVFREGPVALATRASATIPAIFKPVEYRHRLLVDGGLVDNLPTDIANQPGDEDIVIGVLPIGEYQLKDTNSVFRSLVRAIDIQKDIIIESKKKSADLMIEPDVGSVSMVDLGRSAECIEAGTLAARRAALSVKALVMTRMIERRKAGER